MGKTRLVDTLSTVMGLQCNRVQLNRVGPRPDARGHSGVPKFWMSMTVGKRAFRFYQRADFLPDF